LKILRRITVSNYLPELVTQPTRFAKAAVVAVEKPHHFWRAEVVISLGLLALGHAVRQESLAESRTQTALTRVDDPIVSPVKASTSFPDGMYWVANDGDVRPGLYRAPGVDGRRTYWEKFRNVAGDGLPSANYCAPGRVYVELRSGEFFRSENSGGWTLVNGAS
jgi:hypothetical protein